MDSSAVLALAQNGYSNNKYVISKQLNKILYAEETI